MLNLFFKKDIRMEAKKKYDIDYVCFYDNFTIQTFGEKRYFFVIKSLKIHPLSIFQNIGSH
jgi:hypothetical protein